MMRILADLQSTLVPTVSVGIHTGHSKQGMQHHCY